MLMRIVYDPSNHCFTTIAAAAKSDPWNWYKRPALQYLDDEPCESTSVVRRKSSLSATARAFVPQHTQVIQNKPHGHQSQVLVPYDQQAYAAQHQEYAVAPFHTQIALPPQKFTQLVQYHPFERSHKRRDMERVDSSKAIIGQVEVENTDLCTKYKGEETKFQKRNADCTEEENVSIRMNGLPPDVTMAEVLDTIFEGRVFSSSLVSPKPPAYLTAAANITFLTLEAANAFYDRGMNEGVWIRRYRAHVIRNRNRVRYFDRADELEQSRVLQIFGPASIFSVGEVMYFLHWFIDFKEVVPLKMSLISPDMLMLEVVFQSIYGQSRQAKKGFEDLWMTGQFNSYGKHYQVAYGLDPCDPAARFSGGG
ncbi:hypothetical protein BDZ45DRAFT_135037 [Acephala macrosclerotiorum]|nr:hypothetical protein BDZ45DRAFT_135037 [Acephala macrosclerotiorum]